MRRGRVAIGIGFLILSGSVGPGCRDEPHESSLSGASVPLPGDTVTIDFEVDALQKPLPRGTLVDEQYADFGVHFNAAFRIGTRSRDFTGCTTGPITENMLCTWVAWKDTGTCFEPVGGASAQLVIDVDFPVCEARIDARTRCDQEQDGDQLIMTGYDDQDALVKEQSYYTNTGPAPSSENKIDGLLDTTSGRPFHRIVIEDGELDSLDNIRLTRCACSPPEITCPPPITVECTGSHCGEVPPPPAIATGGCDPIVVQGPGEQCFPLGTTETTYTATDAEGQQATCHSSITVVDTLPPVTVPAPPISFDGAFDHDYEIISLADCVASIEDQCEGPGSILTSGEIVRVTSDEPESAAGSGRTCEDIKILDETTVKVRRERAGGGDGRVYTIYYTVNDGSGNVSQSTCTIGMCHSAGQCPAVDSGCAYCVGIGCGTCPSDDASCPMP